MPKTPREWERLEEHQIPAWFADAKLGIYFHWGPYSVPAFGSEWYPRRMYKEGSAEFEHHRETYGPQDEFGYKDFIPSFHGDSFDAERWVDYCERAGAEFVGVTAIHHDGFALWDSDLTEWNAVERGPKRDVLGALATAVKDRDMKFVAAFHHAWNWWYYPRDPDFDTMDPAYAGLYGPPHAEGADPPRAYFEEWRDKTIEVIDGYRPDLLWFDFGWGNDQFAAHDEVRRQVVDHYYTRAEEWGKSVGICHKRNLPVGVGILDYERSRRESLAHQPWVTDTSIDFESWGYVENADYKDVRTLATGFVDRLSKNGNTLLNVGPRPDGTLPDEAVELLESFGEWVDMHSEAVYGTRPWWTFGEGPTEVTSSEFEEASRISFTSEDIRFTRRGERAYVFLMDWPDDRQVMIETSPNRRVTGREDERSSRVAEPVSVSLVGTERAVSWSITEENDALVVTVPEEPPESTGWVYALELTF